MAHFQTTGTVVGDDGKEVAVTMVQMVEKFEKSCKVKLHIVSRSVRWVVVFYPFDTFWIWFGIVILHGTLSC